MDVDANTNELRFDTAIVVGAGIAGLLAAAACAETFRQVIVLEKDRLPASPIGRKSVPQDQHVHALLKGGEERVEALLPGTRDALVAAGGVPVRAGLEGRHFDAGAWQPLRDLGITMHTQTRALLEHTIRHQLLSLPNVTLRDNTRVHDYRCTDTDRRPRITGVVADPPKDTDGSLNSADTERPLDVLPADLVVDATGRGRWLTRWLTRSVATEVPTSVCEMDICYVTGIFAKPPAWRGRAASRVLRPSPPDTRSGSLISIEGDRWLLTLTGRFGDFPPTDLPGFLEFAKELEDPEIYSMISQAELVVPIARYRIPRSEWHHFERMAAFPVRLVPLGDTVGSFNPLYAQGMSQAAQHALALRDCLREASNSMGTTPAPGRPAMADELTDRCLAAISEITNRAWQASTVGDFAYSKTKGERPANLAEQLSFQRGLRQLLAEDEDVHRLVFRVRSLLEPAHRLREPELLARLHEANAQKS